ncbi:MAG: outer membrane beta-barrel protein [Pseudomonadota bacterium]
MLYNKILPYINTFTGVCLFAFLALVADVKAQEIEEPDDVYTVEQQGAAIGVRERPRPDYDPVGARIGSFLFYPSVKTGVEFDDNIFALSSGAVDDIIYLIDPQLVLKSQWSRHRLDFDFSLNHKEYQDNDDESYTDYKGTVESTVDVTRDFKIDASLFGGVLHEPRGSADSPTASTAAEPTEYSQVEAKVSLNKTFNRLTMSFGAAYLEYDYDDVSASGGGVIDQDNRDGDIVTLVQKSSYEFSPGYKAFVYGEYNTRDFVGNPGLDRDSEGYRILSGVEFEVSRILKGEVGLGYLEQDYSEATFEDIDGFSYRSGFIWHPTSLMTIKANGERSVAETVVSGASGRLDTTAAVTLDYEILRNLIASPFFSYQFSDFKGDAREDTYITTGMNVDYMLNRHFHFGMSYNYIERDSNEVGLDYDRQKVGAHVKAQF